MCSFESVLVILVLLVGISKECLFCRSLVKVLFVVRVKIKLWVGFLIMLIKSLVMVLLISFLISYVLYGMVWVVVMVFFLVLCVR